MRIHGKVLICCCKGLSRVERVDVTFGNEIRTWYFNVTKAISDSFREIGMKDLLKEEARLVDNVEM